MCHFFEASSEFRRKVEIKSLRYILFGGQPPDRVYTERGAILGIKIQGTSNLAQNQYNVVNSLAL